LNPNITNQALKKIAKGAGIVFFGLITGKALGYLTRMFIARFMGPDVYGLVSLGLGIFGIATAISLFGLSHGITRYISFYKGKGNFGKIKGTIISSLKMTFPLSLALSAGLFILAGQISADIFSKPALTPVIKLFALAVPFAVLSIVFISSIKGFQIMAYKVYVDDILKNVSTLVAVVLLFWAGLTLTGAVLAYAVGFVFAAALGGYYLEKAFPIIRTKIKAIPTGRELLAFSWPLAAVAMLGLIMAWTDTLMLGYFRPAADVGIYNAALPTAMLIIIILASFYHIFTPVISELYSRGKKEELRQTYKTVTRWIFSLTIPLFLIMLLFPKQILAVLFGPKYFLGAVPLMILAFGFFVNAAVGLTGQTILTIGKTKTNLFLGAIGASSNFTLNAILIPIYGIVGAAVATAASLILLNVISLGFVHRYLRVQPYTLSYVKITFAAFVPFAALWLIANYLVIPTLAFVLLLVPLLLCYALLFLLIGGFCKEDVAVLRAVEKKIGIKIGWLRALVKRFI
jgi:O-antigen/teichoic acid export membrane protein